MWNQTDIFGNELKIPEKIGEVCCESCYTAQDEVCTCRCHGAFHGLGNLNKKKEEESEVSDNQPEYSLKVAVEQTEGVHPDNQPPTLEWYRGQITQKTCDCKTRMELKAPVDLSHLPIEHYDHDGGWRVLGFKERQWLYITCPKCSYQWALWKLGVSRDSGEPLRE